MRILLIALLIISLFCVDYVFADKIIVPFPCFPKEIQKLFADEGYKLDLDPNDRTHDSWGFLKNEGSQFIIFTYQTPTNKEFTMMKEIIFKSKRW